MATPAKFTKKKNTSGERKAVNALVYVMPDSSAKGKDQMQCHGKIVPMIKPKKNARPQDWHKTAYTVLGFYEWAQPKLGSRFVGVRRGIYWTDPGDSTPEP
jgi:hypothetical protein